jgi:hypothetical protein
MFLATLTEIILGGAAVGATGAVGYQAVKNQRDPAYHTFKADQAKTAKAEADKAKAEKKSENERKAAQKLAVSLIKSKEGVYNKLGDLLNSLKG